MKLRRFSISSDSKPFGCLVDRLNTSERVLSSPWVASQIPRMTVTGGLDIMDESVTQKKDMKRQLIVAAALSQKISSVRVTTTAILWLLITVKSSIVVGPIKP